MLNNYLDLNYSFKLPFDVVKDTDIKKQIFEKDYIMLLGIESEKEISKILEKNADKHIIILRNRYLDKRFINRIIDCAKNKCKKIIFQIKDKEKSSCLFDEVETKQLYENANLLKQNGFDVAIYSKGYQYEYKIEEVLNANRILHNWANLILNATVEGRRLSVKERYLFAYMTVINYFNYNIENVGDPAVVSRTAINVLNGDKITGVTTMYMDTGMDTGDIILKEEVKIGEDETTGELWDRLAKIGGELLVKTLQQIEKGTAQREKQGENFTIAPMLSKEMAKIDWDTKTAQDIKNLVRGLNPIMGAYTYLNGKKIKFWKVEIAKSTEIMVGGPMDFMKNGTVIVSDPRDGLFIKTKEGILKILEIQAENARKMSMQDFLRGNSIQEFEVFES